MRLAMLTGCAAAAISLIGSAAAQAETIYMSNGAEVMTTEPTYTYSVPGPLPFSRFVVTEHAPVVVTEPQSVVVTERPAVVAAPPARVIKPRRARTTVFTAPAPAVVAAPAATTVVERPLDIVPDNSGIVTTGYSTVRSCFTDLIGIERCY